MGQPSRRGRRRLPQREEPPPVVDGKIARQPITAVFIHDGGLRHPPHDQCLHARCYASQFPAHHRSEYWLYGRFQLAHPTVVASLTGRRDNSEMASSTELPVRIVDICASRVIEDLAFRPLARDPFCEDILFA